MRPQCDGSQDFDLCLRLDAAGIRFQLVPFFLYAWRVHSGSTAFSLGVKDYATPAGVTALRDYCAQKKLDWEITPGFMKTTYRAIPRLNVRREVQVIIPYRDQKEMTLRAVRSALAQRGMTVRITAVDNQSEDLSIRQEIEALGGEVIRVDEPFNYSRLNNIGVRTGRYASLDRADSLFE